MNSASKAIMEVHNISISYGIDPVITELSLELHSNSFIGLIGPNGAGKTTLLLSLSGQLRPQQGQIIFENFDIYQRNLDFKGKIGYVHENPFFYSYLTLEEFLYFVGRIKKVGKNKIDSQVESMLRLVSLYDKREERTSILSMGMRKKLAIGAALINDPQIIFLDEALNGIDIEAAFQIKQFLKEFVSKGGTVILSSHVLEVIEKICDRYIVLKGGKILADLASTDCKSTDPAKIDDDLEKHIIHLLNVSFGDKH